MCATNSNKYDNKPSYLPVYAVHCGALQYNTMQWEEGVQGGREGWGKSIRRSFFVGAAMRSMRRDGGGGDGAAPLEQLVGGGGGGGGRTRGLKLCLARPSSHSSVSPWFSSTSARPLCGRLPTVPLIGKAMFVRSLARSVVRHGSNKT